MVEEKERTHDSILTTRFACVRSPLFSPYINFLVCPLACPFGHEEFRLAEYEVYLFSSGSTIKTEQRLEARDTIARCARCRDATRTRSSYRSFAPPVFRCEGEERERESGQPILSLYRDLRTHPCEKLFSFSFHRVLTRLSRKRKNSLASTFPTDLWQTVFVHFFFLFFFFISFF